MKKKAGSQFRTVFAHIVLILLSFMCLFFFYVLIINATRSHGDLQKGFSALPGKYFLENLKNVANDGSFPMFRGILNSVIVSSCSAALCTYFSSLTAYGLYAYEFKARKVAFTFIMAILVMPTQVTAMGFLRLVTKMGLYDSLLPLIIPSATTQERSDSIAASTAMVNAFGIASSTAARLSAGRWKPGSALLIEYRSPMVEAFNGRNFTIRIPATTASREPGIFLKI